MGESEPAAGAQCQVPVGADREEKIIEFHEVAQRRGATSVHSPASCATSALTISVRLIRDLDGPALEVVHGDVPEDPEEDSVEQMTWKDFEKVELRAGTVVEVEDFPEARKPADKLNIDFGQLGVKRSSARRSNLSTAS